MVELPYDNPIVIRVEKPNGYLYFIDVDHPLANAVGRVYHHRHVASVQAGRWLRPDELVHHRDGNRANNDAANLVVMTRSCHSVMHRAERGHKPRLKRRCDSCHRRFKQGSSTARFCSRACASLGMYRAIKRPSKDTLGALVWKIPCEQIGAQFGVSGAAVSKWCKRYGLEKPGRGYWARVRRKDKAQGS